MPIDHFPARARPALYRLRGFLMTDATALLILGVGCVTRGLSYAGLGYMYPNPMTLHPLERIMPMPTWAIVWTFVGVLCLAAAATSSMMVDMLALGTGVALHVLWGMSFLLHTLVGESDRAWVTSISYFMITSLLMWSIWRGKRGDVPMEKETNRGVM